MHTRHACRASCVASFRFRRHLRRASASPLSPRRLPPLLCSHSTTLRLHCLLGRLTASYACSYTSWRGVDARCRGSDNRHNSRAPVTASLLLPRHCRRMRHCMAYLALAKHAAAKRLVRLTNRRSARHLTPRHMLLLAARHRAKDASATFFSCYQRILRRSRAARRIAAMDGGTFLP